MNLLKQKVAQNGTISLGDFIFSKITMSFQKGPIWLPCQTLGVADFDLV
jgi:hypothetical protein